MMMLLLFSVLQLRKSSMVISLQNLQPIFIILLTDAHSEEESRVKLNKLLAIFGLLDTTAEDVFHALSSNVSDFEDAIMIETGIRCKVDCIVTRNTKDYSKSQLSVYTPAEFLQELNN